MFKFEEINKNTENKNHHELSELLSSSKNRLYINEKHLMTILKRLLFLSEYVIDSRYLNKSH